MKRLLMTKRFPWFPGRWMSVMVASLFLSIGPIGSAFAFGPVSSPLPGQFTLQNGRLTAHVVATPFRQVMEEMSRVSGARIRWLGDHAEEKLVSVEFTALPLPEALRRILREMNFLLFYTSTGNGTKLTEVWILSGIGRSQAGHTPLPVSPEKVQPPIADSTSQSEEAEERQAQFAAMPLEILIQTAVGTADPSLRIEAIAYLGRRAAEDSTVEGILSHLASSDNNPQVREAASEVLAGID